MIKTQMDDDHRTQDHDARRDAFLCLAVTIPPRQRARVKAAMGPVLARARIKGSGRDPHASPDCTAVQHGHHQQGGHDHIDDCNGDDFDVAAEVEARLGLISTLCVLGCQYISYFSGPTPSAFLAPSLHFSIFSHSIDRHISMQLRIPWGR